MCKEFFSSLGMGIHHDTLLSLCTIKTSLLLFFNHCGVWCVLLFQYLSEFCKKCSHAHPNISSTQEDQTAGQLQNYKEGVGGRGGRWGFANGAAGILQRAAEKGMGEVGWRWQSVWLQLAVLHCTVKGGKTRELQPHSFVVPEQNSETRMTASILK